MSKPENHLGRYRHKSTREVGYLIQIGTLDGNAWLHLLVGTRKRRVLLSTLTRSWQFEKEQ